MQNYGKTSYLKAAFLILSIVFLNWVIVDTLPIFPLNFNSVNKTMCGSKQDGLCSRIWADKVNFASSEPISIHYAIQNVSDETKIVWHSGFWSNHRINVTNEESEPVSLTLLGEEKRRAFLPEGVREKNAPISLKPLAIDNAWPVINLHDYFLIDIPNIYYVQYVYQEGNLSPVKSNILILNVDD